MASSGPGEATLAPPLSQISPSLTQRHRYTPLWVRPSLGGLRGPGVRLGLQQPPSRRQRGAEGGPLLLPGTEVLAEEPQLATKARCVLACQTPPAPGLLLRGPGGCLGSLGSETALPACPRGCRRQGRQPRGWARASPGRELQNILGRPGSSGKGM